MSLKADNFYLFNDFYLDLSYTKKPVKSSIKDEFLEGCNNFRYKKAVIVMGANATGKTRLGKLLMHIFSFIKRREYTSITKDIEDVTKEAYFCIDIAFPDRKLYRVETVIAPRTGEEYMSSDIRVSVLSTNIKQKDNYETCSSRLDNLFVDYSEDYVRELEKVPAMSWMFRYALDDLDGLSQYYPENEDRYLSIINKVMKILDPRIESVKKIENTEDSYMITFSNTSRSVFIQAGKVLSDGLSSGTKEIIGVAQMIAGMKTGQYGFFFCDEKFSRVHSDSEKALISMLIECMDINDQLFITTHNTEILDMNLPRHSYVFLKRNNVTNSISCVYPGEFLKRNTDSLKNAFENDLFGTAPNIDEIYDIKGM